MAKIVDITDKLNFETNPKIIIKGKEYEVNGDVVTVLKIMSTMDSNPGTEDIVKAYELIFPETTRKGIEELKLSFADLLTVIESAISLVTGEDEDGGEQ